MVHLAELSVTKVKKESRRGGAYCTRQVHEGFNFVNGGDSTFFERLTSTSPGVHGRGQKLYDGVLKQE